MERKVLGLFGKVRNVKSLITITDGIAEMNANWYTRTDKFGVWNINYIEEPVPKSGFYTMMVKFEKPKYIKEPKEAAKAVKEAFGGLQLRFDEKAVQAVLLPVWDKYDLWRSLVYVYRKRRTKPTEVSEERKKQAKAKEWKTKNILEEYKSLGAADVSARLLEGIMTAQPVKVDGEPHVARPLQAVDKLMICAIAVELGNKLREIRNTEGEEAVRKCMTLVKRGTNKFLNVNVAIDMKFVAGRVVDVFKRSNKWRPEQDVEELKEQVWDIIHNLTLPLDMTFRDEHGHMVHEPYRLIAPAAGEVGDYNLCPLFAYLMPKFYEHLDFDKLCDGFKEFGGVFVELCVALGANRPKISRVNSKPVIIPMLKLFGDEEETDEKTDKKPASPSALRKQKHDKADKIERMIEAVDDDSIDIDLNRKTLQISVKKAPKKE